MGSIASQITSLTIVYSTAYSDADQRKHQSSASLAFVRGIYRGPVNFPHKWPVTRKMFPFDEVIMREPYNGVGTRYFSNMPWYYTMVDTLFILLVPIWWLTNLEVIIGRQCIIVYYGYITLQYKTALHTTGPHSHIGTIFPRFFIHKITPHIFTPQASYGGVLSVVLCRKMIVIYRQCTIFWVCIFMDISQPNITPSDLH